MLFDTKETDMQWLLIGGPAHGKVLNIKGGTSIRFPAEDGEDYLYCGQNYEFVDKHYRLGLCYSEGGDKVGQHEIEQLIVEKNLEPVFNVVNQGEEK
jgi:hypothetical protein